MTVVYPNGIIDNYSVGKRKCGQEKYSKILTGFLKDGESETISLKPGESIVGHYSASKKTLSSNFDD